MQITWLGYLLFPAAIFIFILRPRWLYFLTVASIPFTATSLANTTTGVPVSPMIFFGALWMVNRVIAPLPYRAEVNLVSRDKSLTLLFYFLSVAVFSMIMPVIIDGRLWVSSNQINDLYYAPLRLNSHNIKNPLPVIFFVFLTFFWVQINDSSAKIIASLRTYVAAACFVSFWGYMQLLCSIAGVTYPAFIFNNAVLESMKGYEQTLTLAGREIARVSSVTHEPSILAKFLITVFPVILTFVLLRKPLFGLKIDRLFLWIFIGALAVSTSTTALVGLIVVPVFVLFIGRRFRSSSNTSHRALAGVMVVLIVSFFWTSLIQDFIVFTVVAKGDSGSVLERFLSLTTSWSYFLDYPILGVGWGMVTSHDLIVYLLATTGIIGLAIFAILTLYVVRRSLGILKRSSRSRQGQTVVALIGLTAAFCSSLVVGILTGVEFYLGYFYFILALTIATSRVLSREVQSEEAVVQ